MAKAKAKTSKLESLKKWFELLKKDKKRLILYSCLASAVFLILVVIIVLLVFDEDQLGLSALGLGGATLSPFAKSCVEEHNKFRALHKETGPLVWNKKVAAYAIKWSQTNADNNRMYHSKGSPYSENLWAGRGTVYKEPCRLATRGWYSEIRRYNWSKPSAKGAGHFTAMMWKKSTKLGCGIAFFKPKKATYLACSYHPLGNDGGYWSNVKPLIIPTPAPTTKAPAAPPPSN